jgi:MATE family multidrug resistance protein
MIRSPSLNTESDMQDDDKLEEFDRKLAKDDNNEDAFNLWEEMKLLLEIAAPAVVAQFSVLFIFPQTASTVGLTLGTEALAGFSLGSLVGNLTVVSVMTGALTAADILMPRAWGAKNYEEMGILAIRSVIICGFFLLIPVIPLFTSTEWIFDRMGQDRDASYLASQWIRVFLIGVPPVLLFRVAQSFLNSQNHVYPMVFASVVASYLVHPTLLKILVPTMGENGSALAISLTQWVMTGLLFLYLRFRPVEKPETWPRFSRAVLSEALRPKPLLEFISLSLGGVISLSEWWLWETVCFIVGTFGVVPLVVHSIAYNLVPLLFMPTLGIQIGLTVRMGQIIAYDIVKAKLLAMWCMFFTVIFGAILATSLYIFRIDIAMLFTDDVEVVDGCKEIWGKLSCYIFILHIFGINSAILRVLGLQWRMAITIFSFLWFVVLPAIIYFAVHRGGGLDAVWTILPIFYSILQVLLALLYLTADWESIGREIHDRAHGDKSPKVHMTSDESERLLSSDDDDSQ